MPSAHLNGISLHYETQGSSGTPVLLVVGLGGVGRAWGPQIELLAREHRVIVPDHRGAGGSTFASDGYTIEQHARDMVALVRHLDCGPVHVVGSSTGGAIAQVMALDHAEVVRTVVMASSWGRTDGYVRRQFETRKRILVELGQRAAAEAGVLFVFSPEYIHANPERIEAWVTALADAKSDPAIGAKRIDMILAHDQLARLKHIRCPVLVVVGDRDFCTPPYLSEEIAHEIPGAKLQTLNGGHFIYLEDPAGFHASVAAFIARHD